MSDILLAIRGLSIQIGGATVLSGPLELDLAKGEHMLLVGRSGSGKTSLLRAIAGLIAPVTGSIVLDGLQVSAPGKIIAPPQARGIGYLPQGGALWPHLNVQRTLEFVLARNGTSKKQARARVSELLDLGELSGFEKRLPGSLSGGEAQRVALARALAPRPRLLLMDEPLGPLDAELRMALLKRLAALKDELGFSALHVTHDPREAASIADRTMRLDAGRLVDHDPTAVPAR